MTYYGLGENWTDLGIINPGGGSSLILNFGNGTIMGIQNGANNIYSVDYGANWTVMDIQTDPASDNGAIKMEDGQGIVGTGHSPEGSINKTVDYGNTWAEISISSNIIATLGYLESGIVLAADGTTIFRSTNYGNTWTDTSPISHWYEAFTYVGGGIVIAGTDAGTISRSIDYGETWTDLGQVSSLSDLIYTMTSIPGGIIIACYSTGNIIRSTDSGETWTDLGQISPQSIISSDYFGQGVVIVGSIDNHLYRSTDYGLNWTDAGDFFYSPDAISYIGNGVGLIYDDAAHVWRSEATTLEAPGCGTTKYSGDSINLQASPNGAVGPYFVRFWRMPASGDTNSLLYGEIGEVRTVNEGSSTSTSFTLYDTDLVAASGNTTAGIPTTDVIGDIIDPQDGTAQLAVGKMRVVTTIYDSCPTGAQSCISYCDVTLGCVAPTCNFTVI